MTTPQQHRQRVARRSEYAEWVVESLGSGLGAYWPFDDDVGSAQAEDVSGNDRHGSYEGVVQLQAPSIVRGLRGSMRGDGVTGYMSYANGSGGLEPGTSDATVAFWSTLHPDQVDDTVVWQVYGAESGGEGTLYIRWRGDLQRMQGLLRGVSGENAVVNVPVSHPTSPNLTVMRWDSSDFQLQGWANGNTDSAQNTNITDVTITDWAVGASDSGNRPFAGRIQHIAIWPNRRLTDAEIEALYEQGAKFWDEGRLR